MSTTLKVIIGLALTLPLVAYVSGSLITPSSFETDRRQPVIMQPVDDTSAPETPPDGRDPGSDDPGRGDDQGRAGDDQDGGDRVDDNGIQVVTPKPTGVDDDDDDDGDDGDDDDDEDEDDSRDDDDGDDDGDDD